MPQLERNITKQIVGHLKQQGAWVVKLHGGPFQTAGLPDILCILNGVHLFFEVKTETGRITKIQDHAHDLMRRAGALVAVVRSVDDVQRLMSSVNDRDTWNEYML